MSLVKVFSSGLAPVRKTGTLSPVDSRGGWWPIIRESYPGAFQNNIEVRTDSVLAFHAVFACITLIAADVGKMRIKLVELVEGIWRETASTAFSPVLRKPNRYQNHIQFKEWWITSKLIRGNAYALKQRDNRGIVVALYLLDPCLVTPLVAPDGSVFYQIKADNLTGLPESITVPASEIIHDRMNCLFHPLVGISPLFASGLAATAGLRIQANSANLFGNQSQPGGVLTAPGSIGDATADRLKAYWDTNFTGANVGKVAVLGDGLKYERMSITAVEAQLIEQLKWTAQTVCSTFHVPPFKIGVGDIPEGKIEDMNQIYYTDCLQSLIESMELCLDEGLGLDKVEGRTIGTELDIKALLRMDHSSLMEYLSTGVGAAIFSPNEARREVDLPPVTGGESPMIQQQNYSLEAIAKRDAQADPFGTAQPALPAPDAEPEDDPAVEEARVFYETLLKGLTLEA